MNNNPMTILSQMMQMGKNPQQIMQQIRQMAMKNPQMQQMLNQIQVANNQMQQSGMSPQQYVQQFAKQNNLNLQPMLQMLNQMGIKL